jgi:hypothetical protein
MTVLHELTTKFYMLMNILQKLTFSNKVLKSLDKSNSLLLTRNRETRFFVNH